MSIMKKMVYILSLYTCSSSCTITPARRQIAAARAAVSKRRDSTGLRRTASCSKVSTNLIMMKKEYRAHLLQLQLLVARQQVGHVNR